MVDADQHAKIVSELEMLNAQMRKQNSVRRVFVLGIVYGIGFVVGSVIIATIGLGVTVPMLEDIPWIRATFERGAALPR